jgi:hypothetical protein
MVGSSSGTAPVEVDKGRRLKTTRAYLCRRFPSTCVSPQKPHPLDWTHAHHPHKTRCALTTISIEVIGPRLLSSRRGSPHAHNDLRDCRNKIRKGLPSLEYQLRTAQLCVAWSKEAPPSKFIGSQALTHFQVGPSDSDMWIHWRCS